VCLRSASIIGAIAGYALLSAVSSSEDRKLIRYIGLGTGVHFALSVSAAYGGLFGRWENLESMGILMGKNLGRMEKFHVRIGRERRLCLLPATR
jgi:hypothetical protein